MLINIKICKNKYFLREGPPEWLVWFNYLTSYLSLLIWLVTTVLGFYW